MIPMVKKLLNRLKEDQRFREVVMYLLFGVLTTVVNYGVYWLLTLVFGLRSGEGNDIAMTAVNVVAWALSVAFAYVTNRKYVFESKATGRNNILREMGLFVSARLASLVLFDVLGFQLCISLLKMNDLVAKLLLNVLVVLFNYVASKLVVFKKKKEERP